MPSQINQSNQGKHVSKTVMIEFFALKPVILALAKASVAYYFTHT